MSQICARFKTARTNAADEVVRNLASATIIAANTSCAVLQRTRAPSAELTHAPSLTAHLLPQKTFASATDNVSDHGAYVSATFATMVSPRHSAALITARRWIVMLRGREGPIVRGIRASSLAVSRVESLRKVSIAKSMHAKSRTAG